MTHQRNDFLKKSKIENFLNYLMTCDRHFEDMSHDRFSQLTSIIVDLIHNNWNIQHPLLANNGDMEREEVTATN